MSAASVPAGLLTPTAASRRRFSKSEAAVVAAAVVALLVLVAGPLIFLVGTSVWVDGGFSLAAYRQVLTRGIYYSAFLNTLWLGLGATALAVLFGTPIAWAVTRTDMPFRATVRAMANTAYVFPPFLLAIAYVILLAPNAGALNRLWVELFGVERGPFNAYTLGTLILVTGLHTFPTVFLLVSAALESLDPSLEHAAQILGASRMRTTLRITLPLVLPSILTAALLAFVNAIALFGSQAILGIPGRIYTLPTRVYQVLGYPPDYAIASALSMLLVVLTVLALWLQKAWLAGRMVATIGGKATAHDTVHLGPWRWFALAGSAAIGLMAVVLPLIALVGVSLMHAWPQGFSLDNLTFQNYIDVLSRNSITRSAIAHSLVLGVVTATIAIVLGVVLALIDLRGRFPGRKALDFLALIPLGLPGIVLAVAILQLWLRVPVPLYGTFAILLLAYVTRFLPLAVQSARTALSQVDPSLEEAARIGGVSRMNALWRITIPLSSAGLVAGWILVFVPTIQELSASVLLFTPETMTLAVAIFNFQDNGQLEAVSALGITMVVIISVALWIVRLLRRRSSFVKART